MLHHASQTSAIIINSASMIPHLPEHGLIGRDTELTTLQHHLNTTHRIWLTGDGGIGKSALAASVAATLIVDDGDSILWLWLADNPIEELFEAMVRPFRQQQLVATLSEGARTLFLHHLLEKFNIRCVVLDDARNLNELVALLSSIPPHIPLIITARHAPKNVDVPIIHLLGLHLADSISLFHTHANALIASDVENTLEELCQLLAGNPYLLRIIGKTLAVTRNSIENALEFISTATTPVVETVIAFVHATVDEPTQRIFEAFGGFFALDVSAELMALYDVERPHVTDTQIAEFRSRIPASLYIDDTQLHEFLIGQAVQGLTMNTEGVQRAMGILHSCGLVDIIPANDDTVVVYRLHDVTHETLQNIAHEDRLQRASDACQMLMRRHNEPHIVNFAALEAVLKNLHKAADWTMQTRRYADAERFAWDLYANSQFLDFRGYYTIAKYILTIAEVAAQQLRNPRNQAIHLRHLGMCHYDTDHPSLAANAFRRAVTLFHQIGDVKSEVNTLAALGDSYRGTGYFDQAIETYQQALQISRELDDAWGQSKALANLGRSYRRMGRYADAIHHIEQSLAICRGMVDLGGEANMLRYLGNIYRETGDTRQSVEHYMAALTLVREIGDRKMEANILGNLGEVYHRLSHAGRADEYYHQAYQLYQDIKDSRGLIDIMTKIAQLAFVLKDYDKALHYFEGARELGSEQGDTRQEAISMWSIATVYDSSGDTARAKAYFDDVQALYEALELGDMKHEES